MCGQNLLLRRREPRILRQSEREPITRRCAVQLRLPLVEVACVPRNVQLYPPLTNRPPVLSGFSAKK
jgi:hypothetical protein